MYIQLKIRWLDVYILFYNMACEANNDFHDPANNNPYKCGIFNYLERLNIFWT